MIVSVKLVKSYNRLRFRCCHHIENSVEKLEKLLLRCLQLLFKLAIAPFTFSRLQVNQCHFVDFLKYVLFFAPKLPATFSQEQLSREYFLIVRFILKLKTVVWKHRKYLKYFHLKMFLRCYIEDSPIFQFPHLLKQVILFIFCFFSLRIILFTAIIVEIMRATVMNLRLADSLTTSKMMDFNFNYCSTQEDLTDQT